MKLTGILMLIACLQVSARTNAQLLNISVKNGSLENLFKEIEKKSNYSYAFFYDVSILKATKPVTVEMKRASVDEVLKAALKDEPVEYFVVNNTIFIKRKVEKAQALDLQTRPGLDKNNLPEVSGNVTGENGEPLSGATIKLKGGKVVAITDEKGNFRIKNVAVNAAVEVSYTGYHETEVPVDGKSALNISLKRSMNKLDEVQVIAYGRTTERMTTGDVTTVTSKEIETQPVTNVLSAIEGRVPGLLITQTSGLPGGSFSTQIRGISSLFNGTDPFFVIDGVPYNSELPTANGFGLINNALNGGNPLNFINPYDIESVEVLKDADATAIYGSRAANGAILITTKRGKEGKMAVNLSVNSGISSPTRDIKLLNTQQYLQVRREAFANDNSTPSPNFDYDLTFWDTTRYTDWANALLYKPASYSDFEGSVSGGTATTQYLIGGGFNRQTTGMPVLVPGSGGDNRGSVHFNINTMSPDKRFKVSLTGSYTSDDNQIQANDVSSLRFGLPPDAPALFNTNGSLNWDPQAPGEVGTWQNPLTNLLQTYKGITSNLVGSASIGYMLFRGLEVKADLGYTNTQTNEISTIPTTSLDPGRNSTSGQATFSAFNSHSWIAEPQVHYTVPISKGVLTTLIGGSFHANDQSAQVQSASGFISDALLQDISAASRVINEANGSQYKYNAAFGRLNYTWQSKYIINLNARRDGSSRFGPGRQFGNFGSVGAAWIFTKERIVEQLLPGLSFGKLRGSYGTSGNDQIGDYQFLSLYRLNEYQYENSPGLTPSSLANPNLEWETNKKLEAGIELGFLKDRILLQASYYRNRSGNQLVQEGVSYVTGFNSLPANLPAVVQNSGEEYSLHTINIRLKNFTWTSSFNISVSRNKLLSFPGLATSTYANLLVIGQPVSSQPVFHMIGVNDSTGLYQFSTFKGNPSYSPNAPDDWASRITLVPKYFGGFQNSFRYKTFTLDIFLQFVKQVGRNIFGLLGQPPGMKGNVPTAFLNSWHTIGDQAKFEQYTQNSGSAAYTALSYAQQSDFAYSDASFVRLKNLSMSWQVPDNWKNRIHLQNARIFIQGQNLLTFTKYFGIDPETQSTNSPPKRILTAGFQVSL